MSFPFKPVASTVVCQEPLVLLHPEDAQQLGLQPGDRVSIAAKHGTQYAPIGHHVGVPQGYVGCPPRLAHLVDEAVIHLEPVALQDVRPLVRRKLDGHALSRDQMAEVVRAIGNGKLTDVDIAIWAAAIHTHGMSEDEIISCIDAMVAAGNRIEFDVSPVVDVHSIGGLPGNKYAPMCIAILAESGLLVPKTSSRAISSACGTADFMECLAPISFNAHQLHALVLEAGGSLAWGGGVDLAPADDRIVQVEHPLSLDPPAQLLASVLAKKKAVGATHVLIDIPCGPGTKIATLEEGQALARQFVALGRRLRLHVGCTVELAAEPLGRAIGPVLEAREVLAAFAAPTEHRLIVAKAVALAGRVFEMVGHAPAGQGPSTARALVDSGRAAARFKRILAAQGGDPDIQVEDIPLGTYHETIAAPCAGRVGDWDLKALVRLARMAGAPRHHGAGLYLHVEKGQSVQLGEPLFDIYANSESLLGAAALVARAELPLRLEGPESFGFVG